MTKLCVILSGSKFYYAETVDNTSILMYIHAQKYNSLSLYPAVGCVFTSTNLS